MSNAQLSFVRNEILAERPAPSSNSGLWGWMKTNLFSSALNTILTILGVWFLILILPALYSFMIGDAVFSAENNEPCKAEGAGACWAYIRARMSFFIYGFFPPDMSMLPAGLEISEANFTQRMMAYWRVNVVYFFGLALIIPLLIPDMPKKSILAFLFFIVYPVAAILLLDGRALGLENAPSEKWGGLLVTLVLGITAIVVSLPFGILLALGRQSKLPIIKYVCVGFIELWRAVPLITILFMASIMLPLFMPQGVTFDKLLRAVVAISLFTSAYMAEVIRGGLQAIPKGQYEAADAMGLTYWKSRRLIVLPQALKIVIPGIVNTFVSVFKDTSLVAIIGIFDFLKTVESANNSALEWASETQAITGYVFAAIVYWLFCFSMTRYSAYVERRLDTGHKS